MESDVLETDISQWGSAVVAGNLPYYITSPILRKILSLGPRLRQAVLLVQKEVAERLAAKPGSRRYGFLTVETSLYATTEILFTLPPSAFRPSPKVDSAVVRLLPSASTASLRIEDQAKFLHFVGLSFHQKRKTISNNLAGHYGRTLLDSRPEASLRAEQLSLAQFAQLFHDLEQGCATNL